MDSVPLEMDDIFAEHEDEDDNFPAPLPDLPEELEPLDMSLDDVNPSQDTENAEVLAKLKDLSKGAARRVVRRPIPKLDSARLTGDRGIPILPQVFKDITFKGKGHEAEDLKLIMGKLEHWAHRLFPKMPFDEVLEKIEKLGSKKDVQTCIKKMRLDMPVLDEDFVTRDEENDLVTEPADTGEVETNDPQSVGKLDQDAEEAFDEMMRENEEEETNNIPSSPYTPRPSSSLVSPSITPGHGSSVVSPSITPGHSSSVVTPSATPRIQGMPVTASGSTPSHGLTPDQMERIERNRRLAMEKRNARLHSATGTKSAQPTVSGHKSPVKDQTPSKNDDTVSTVTVHDSNASSSQEDTFTDVTSTALPVSTSSNSPDEGQQVMMSKVNEKRIPAISTLAGSSRVKQVADVDEELDIDAEEKMQVSVGGQQERISQSQDIDADKEMEVSVEGQQERTSQSQDIDAAKKMDVSVEGQQELTLQIQDFDAYEEMQVSVEDQQEQTSQSQKDLTSTAKVLLESPSQEPNLGTECHSDKTVTDGGSQRDIKLTENQNESTSPDEKKEVTVSNGSSESTQEVEACVETSGECQSMTSTAESHNKNKTVDEMHLERSISESEERSVDENQPETSVNESIPVGHGQMTVHEGENGSLTDSVASS
ncbi:chromosome segregation in meiosis protein 3-like isoform X2 [Gigantopelta aegis]|nr:chromosome segregation in meiosis protein 3-like isoform X2 [Gigantopelta aegis]XP_041360589.1 chromosome segregation in meiosis protein 3-like isoform X2 [Gigantopelta aegis]